jgi:hypothetical protein
MDNIVCFNNSGELFCLCWELYANVNFALLFTLSACCIILALLAGFTNSYYHQGRQDKNELVVEKLTRKPAQHNEKIAVIEKTAIFSL